MGALLIVQNNSKRSSTKYEKGLATMAHQGFSAPLKLEVGGYLIALYKKQVTQSSNYLSINAHTFCASVGTLIYKRSIGTEALAQFYEDFKSNSISIDETYGAYCVVIATEDRLYVGIDSLQLYRLYESIDSSVISSSFLTTAACLDNRTINPQCLYEYVFQGATYGGETLFREIRLLDNRRIQTTSSLHSLPINYPEISPVVSNISMNESLLRNHEKLSDQFQAITQCFGTNIDTALSGGYDSRLTLALLLEQQCTPKLHVYGKNSDQDVVIAKQVSNAENIPLSHVDKSSVQAPDADNFHQCLLNNLYAFDGLPIDGIFKSNADLESRIGRCAGGGLMLNGGGGEIYRNFFYILNRPMKTRSILRTFYSQFDPNSATSVFRKEDYFESLGEKIRDAVGVSTDTLTRPQIDLLYPLFRCRYWMGTNNAINNRLGYFLTPFIDHRIVQESAQISTEFKDHGVFEAALIEMINVDLARYPSVYGHNFIGAPKLVHRIKNKIGYLRPSVIRQYTFRIRTRNQSEPMPICLSRKYLDQAFPDGQLFIERYLNTMKLRDPGQLSRALSIEFLLQQYAPTNLPDSLAG